MSQEKLLEAFNENDLGAVREALSNGAEILNDVFLDKDESWVGRRYFPEDTLFKAIKAKVSHEIFEFLLDNGAKIINPTSSTIFSAQGELSQYGSLHHLLDELGDKLDCQLVELFMKNGAIIIQDNNGREMDNRAVVYSTLKYVVEKGNVDLASFLLEKYSDGIDKDDTKYIDIALTKSNPEILNLLAEAGMKIDNSIDDDIRKNNYEIGGGASVKEYINGSGKTGSIEEVSKNALGKFNFFDDRDEYKGKLSNKKIDILLLNGAIPENLSDLHNGKKSMIKRRNYFHTIEPLEEIIGISRMLFGQMSNPQFNISESEVIRNILNNSFDREVALDRGDKVTIPEESIDKAIEKGRVLADKDLIKQYKKFEDQKIINESRLNQSTVELKQDIEELDLPEEIKLKILSKIGNCINLVSQSHLDESSISKIVSQNISISYSKAEIPNTKISSPTINSKGAEESHSL